jgi:hypothetical protein
LYENYKSDSILLCLKLLSQDNIASVAFELAQFTCSILGQVQEASSPLLSEECFQLVQQFAKDPSNRLRFVFTQESLGEGLAYGIFFYAGFQD